MATIRGVMVDLSGTLHVENTVIPGSVEALKRLRDIGLAVRFVTNTTKESKGTLLNRLRLLGFHINEDEVFTSLTAARRLVEANDYRPFYLLEEDALRDFEGISWDNPNAVVIGLSPTNFCYRKLNDAFRLLLNGCPLIAIHKARYFKREDGLALGPGPFAAALEYAAGVTAKAVGKPEPSFFQTALADMGLPPENTVIIGDDAKDDIAGAQKIGIKGLLVRTGKYRTGDKDRFGPPALHTAKNFPEAVDFIQRMCNINLN
ncbi:haloacid dehalogenase-like hydrolase domain-containing protein 2 [Dendronephthya gigantea]|uniref:haloacid dehalogenase-like hydrolase domain-containing protein 2 n=1 Tax=Dendronephthya gigantea TaxID=151771 RepID=UPI00106963C2|nr:haloacid dehalogenase-like hydrolase domain-containing protein 2 [Dendronephthya gigantea]